MTPVNARPPVVFLMGPTASGKTALAIELAHRWPFAIISVDSALVYRGLDIGAAKPDAATRALIPHRLIDIRDPTEIYSAAQFRNDALGEIAAIQQDGRLPLLVGGTMLYFRALERGLTALPAADPALRARLAAEWDQQGGAMLHARLARLDSTAAARIHPSDRQRVQRALEICLLTGQSATELYAGSRPAALPFRIVKLILAPQDRDWLHARIVQRWQAMLEQGVIAEVAALRARGDLHAELPALRAVGYRQIWACLEGRIEAAALSERVVIATRQYAKRQLTWLRAETAATWLPSEADDVLERAETVLRAQGVVTEPPGFSQT